MTEKCLASIEKFWITLSIRRAFNDCQNHSYCSARISINEPKISWFVAELFISGVINVSVM